MRRTVLLAIIPLFLSLTEISPAAAAWPAGTPRSLTPKVVNGLPSAGYPSVGLFVNGPGACTATLIGCSTVLTAAHCVCTDFNTGQTLDGAQCSRRSDLLDPTTKLVYFEHAGLFKVSSVAANPNFVLGRGSDLAIVRLAAPVTGIAPSAVDTTAKPALGAAGVIVGFGLTENPFSGAGIKRAGSVTVGTCSVDGVDPAGHVCVNFDVPLGPPGVNSGSCHGDSGGPLFVDFGSGAGPVIAGTTSGGDSPLANCLPPDHLFYDDVYRDRAWIQATSGSDLSTGACGGLPAAGGPSSTVAGVDGALFPSHPSDLVTLTVPKGTTRLRVGLTADGFALNDYDLYLKRGEAPTRESFDCKSDRPGTLSFCEIADPAPGDWHVLVQGASGPGGAYQLVTTLFAQGTPAGCVPSATTLCLDDQPGDRRFRVEVAYQTAQGGGLSGAGHAVPLSSLGVDRGGLFWFFAPDNPELLVKVLNACSAGTPRFWVFYSSGTNVGLTITVTDTVSGHSKTYTNPDLHTATPVQDTDALPCN